MAMPKFGGLLKPKAAATQPQGEVSVSAPDANGVVTWTFRNAGGTTGSWLLQRGASEAGMQFEDYVFGQAFNVAYLNNGPTFGTKLLTAPPEPLVDNGVEKNSMPMAVVDSPSGRFIAFVFTLSPGQTWACLEGGFGSGVTATNGVLIPVAVKQATPSSFCDAWQPEQCQGFDQQTGSNLPCPSNPWTLNGILMETTVKVPILTIDRITDGSCAASSPSPQPCADLLQQAELAARAGDYLTALDFVFDWIFCQIEAAGFDLKTVLRSFLSRVRRRA